MSDFGLLISFDDRPRDFVHGVEFGMIWEKLKSGVEEVSNGGFPIRLQNQELIYRACEHFGYEAHFKECYVSGWIDFIAIKKQLV